MAFAVNDYRIEVTLSAFSLKVFKDGDQVEDIKIGVARDNTPTPGGLYFTTELIKTPNPDGAYGPYAFGLSGFSDTLTTFNGGPGQLGIHGTNEPAAIGTQVSHGCIRMSNDDITAWPAVLPPRHPRPDRRLIARGRRSQRVDEPGRCTAAAMASSALRGSWPPGSQTWVTGPGMAATASSNSSGGPNGSFSPDTNRHGTSSCGKCSMRSLSGLPGGCSG